jgi:hypothetical protein
MSIQSRKWRNIESIFQFIIFFGNYRLRSSQNALQWENCQDWTRFPYPLWRHPSHGQVGSPSNPDLGRKHLNAFRTFTKDHRTWPSRMVFRVFLTNFPPFFIKPDETLARYSTPFIFLNNRNSTCWKNCIAQNSTPTRRLLGGDPWPGEGVQGFHWPLHYYQLFLLASFKELKNHRRCILQGFWISESPNYSLA